MHAIISKMKKPLTALYLFLFFLHDISAGSNPKPQVYIVYLGEQNNGDKSLQEVEENHKSYLHKAMSSREEAQVSLVHSYKNVFNGFSALLASEQASAIAEMDGVISVFPSGSSKLHTTRSWDFINLFEGNGNPTSGENLLSKAGGGEDVIVGVVDSGIWPESQSFNDKGMKGVPKSWKGTCQEGERFKSSNCNRKIIGARYYSKGFEATNGPLNQTLNFRSPRDIEGHGTHTSSTIAGRKVANVSYLGGFAEGTATGGAPLARLAIYKICWQGYDDQYDEIYSTCENGDLLAAIDDAIADGVHVISMSLGSGVSRTYFTRDAIAMGALNAMKRNIAVVCSAGNDGPQPNSVENVAPWIFSVGASSIDRVFSAPVLLGNGMVVKGESIAVIKKNETLSLVFAGDVGLPGSMSSRFCAPNSLSPEKVKGKVVLCLSGYYGELFQSLEVKRAGGAAAILGTYETEVSVTNFLNPATTVFSPSGIDEVRKYIATDKNPVATLIPGDTILGSKPSPAMASFTSLGPSIVAPDILKPDITAPGLNILAAWSEASSPLGIPEDNRTVKYNIISGTSMACPHVAAMVALLKAIHPDWSSAAIKSALMTTATTDNDRGEAIRDGYGEVANPFHYGSGHFRPSKAADPGLVYNATYTDQLLFVCFITNISLDTSFRCPENPPSPSNLNYPSLAIVLRGKRSTVVKRTVTNVGPAKGTYRVEVKAPIGYSVKVTPRVLRFVEVGEEKSFSVEVKDKNVRESFRFEFGWYKWSDGTHTVRSPIVAASVF